jgi:hypothetical protein
VTDLTTYPLKKRYSKVRVSDFAKPWGLGGSFNQFYRSLPDILGVKTLRAVAKASRRPIVKADQSLWESAHTSSKSD